MRDMFSEREDWKKPVVISAGFHALFAVFVVVAGYVSGARGQTFGGGDTEGQSVTASLVSSIPLPHPQVTTDNILANESKGQTQSVPEQQTPEKPEAIPIPENPTKHRIDRNPVTPTHERPQPTPVPQDNRIPFGQGGPITGSFASFSAPNIKGGIGIQGGGGWAPGWPVGAPGTGRGPAPGGRFRHRRPRAETRRGGIFRAAGRR